MSEQRMSSQLAESLEQSTFHCQRSELEITPFLVVTIHYIPRLYLFLNTGRVCVLPPWKEVHGDVWDQQTRNGRPHHNFLQGELLMLVLGGLIHFLRWEAELPRWEINLPKWDTRAFRWATCSSRSTFCHAHVNCHCYWNCSPQAYQGSFAEWESRGGPVEKWRIVPVIKICPDITIDVYTYYL